MPARRKGAWSRVQAAAPEDPPVDQGPVVVPLWVRHLGVGLRHVAGRPPGDPVVTDDLKRDLALLREARAQWWAANRGSAPDVPGMGMD